MEGMVDPKSRIWPKSFLWSPGNGRDYIQIHGQVFSINGLYCDEVGNQNSWGRFVEVIDVRWVAVTWGVVGQEGESWPRKDLYGLKFVGDSKDELVLEHYGYTWAEDQSEGWKQVLLAPDKMNKVK